MQMKATIIGIFLLASPCMVFGQKENTNDNKNEAAKQEKEQKEDEKEDGLKAVSMAFAEEKKKNKELSDIIEKLKQDKTQTEEQLKKENSAKLRLLEDTIKSLKEKNIQIQKDKEAAVEEKDKIKDRLSRYEEIDRKVYNLFLLHTLEM